MAGPVVNLEEDHSVQLTGRTADASGVLAPAGTITWTSSSPAVATVDQTGLVTGVGAGTSTITAACGLLTSTASIIVSGRAATQLIITAGNKM